ncbi:hypothetical protein V2647_07640 [Tenacibaculum maritimum]|uniref:hypothetical protein n=1 Tax=Tenacibaculum maritimum TaxID=107401 RepID=UPI0012E6A365|nr:hypothetical protein [Tenacibaculum maritimum]CAA0186722.1 conserved hypothetical protein [Tenacibaculum maritimum]CAA0221787.1 hypothetical protein TMP139_40059 [Tenacibaculum maritimum]
MMKALLRCIREGFKRRSILSSSQREAVNESTILEVEKAIENLKKEEEETRLKVINNLKDIFKDLPVLL